MRPTHPLIGVGGVLVHEGRVLLIRRGKEPLKGRWVIPGGTLELGETLQDGLIREMREETGLEVRPGPLLTVFDRIQRDEQGVAYHYVILDYACAYAGGDLHAGSDAEAAAFVAPDELDRYRLPARALEVVADAFRREGIELPDLLPGDASEA